MKIFKKARIIVMSTIMTLMFSVHTVVYGATPVKPTKPSDVEAYNNLMDIVAFGLIILSALIVATASIRWGYLHFLGMHEDEAGKLAELDDKKKKLIKNSILGLSCSIVGSILAFFV